MRAVPTATLFGAFIYSDLDQEFATYIERSLAAVHAVTGDDVLLFAFGSKDDDPVSAAALDYVCYRSIMETPGRLARAMTPAEIDAMRAREERELSHVRGRNKSLLFGRRLFGVSADQAPCLVLWSSLDEDRFLTIPLAASADFAGWAAAVKQLAKTIADAVSDHSRDPLDHLAATMAGLLIRRGESAIGDFLRTFLSQTTSLDGDGTQ